MLARRCWRRVFQVLEVMGREEGERIWERQLEREAASSRAWAPPWPEWLDQSAMGAIQDGRKAYGNMACAASPITHNLPLSLTNVPNAGKSPNVHLLHSVTKLHNFLHRPLKPLNNSAPSAGSPG